jgi:signal transduction histidine kinase
MDARGQVQPYGLGVELATTVQRVRAWARALPVWVLDAVIATGMVVAGFASALSDPPSNVGDMEPLDPAGYLLIACITVPYYLRRRHPLEVFTVSALGLVVFTASGYYEGVLPIVVLVGIYAVGAWCPPRRIAIGFGVMAVALLALWTLDVPGFNASELVANAAFFTVSLLFGWTMQSRRLRLVAAEERAEILEREQEEERRRAVADERLHIAQELHDVVAHSMSVIAVQAGVGMHVVDHDPAEAKRALENISTTSRSTLTELRRLLGVLRDDGSGAVYAPAPGLRDLTRLADEVTEAGVPVEVTIDAGHDEVPPGVDFTAYRIVQEALTNVLKHAGPSRASVVVSNTAGALHIDVVDDGRGVNGRSSGSGHGLVGMRERVGVYGGTLDAGPAPGGGFRVSAVLPYARPGEGSEDR